MSTESFKIKRLEFEGQFYKLTRDVKRGATVLFVKVAMRPEVERQLVELGESEVPVRIICVPIDRWAQTVAGQEGDGP